MPIARTFRLLLLPSLAAAVFACSSAPSSHDDVGPADPDDNEAETGQVSSAVEALPPHCYGKMLMAAPTDLVQPIGQAMTLRVNRQCDRGAPLVDRKIRIYIRRYENGVAGPQQLLVDWTDWPANQYRFEAPWTAGQPALTAGRYQIFSYALNADLYSAWVAGDPYARAMSTRSDNTYIELRDPGTWASTSWSACSAVCDSGTQTRTSTCQDANGDPLETRMCLTSAPASSQACNTGACTYAWTTGTYGSCSVSCGGGTKTRTVTCVRQADGATVDDTFCDAGSRPATSATCNTQSCVTNSCAGHCGGSGGSCFCDGMCEIIGDCCADYYALCY